jgi:hypothetical protein
MAAEAEGAKERCVENAAGAADDLELATVAFDGFNPTGVD